MEYFSNRGWKVLVVPEVATKIILGGIRSDKNELSNLQFQRIIFQGVLEEEALFLKAAEMYRLKRKKVLVLSDRGLMDSAAYIDSLDFHCLMVEFKTSKAEICEERYRGVIHLQTAAIGAEKFYTLENNQARKESLEEAVELDGRTLDAWRRHPHHRLVDNSTDFEGKIIRFEQEIASIIGDPLPQEIERKFLVKEPIAFAFLSGISWVGSFITQYYLLSAEPGQVRRVRKRVCEGEASYTYTEKIPVENGVNIEKERIISRRSYEQLLEFRIPNLPPIRKERRCFFWKGKFFELDGFRPPVSEWMLEVELTRKDQPFELPPRLEVIREVTDDPAYSNRAIAERFRT